MEAVSERVVGPLYTYGLMLSYRPTTEMDRRNSQSWIVSRHCLGLETSRDRFFDVSVSVSVSDPTVSVSVSVSRSFLAFLVTVLFSCRSGLQSSRTNCNL